MKVHYSPYYFKATTIQSYYSVFLIWEKFWRAFLLAYFHIFFKLWLPELLLFKHLSFRIHFGAAYFRGKSAKLSREDVFTLLSDDFNDLFKTWYAPYSKISYQCMRCGILWLVVFCLKVQCFSHGCYWCCWPLLVSQTSYYRVWI